MCPSTLQLSSLGALFPGRGLVREQGEAGTEQGRDLGRMEVRQRGSGLSESAAGTGISLGMHWLVLLESRRLTHLVPAKNLAPLSDGADLCSSGQ